VLRESFIRYRFSSPLIVFLRRCDFAQVERIFHVCDDLTAALVIIPNVARVQHNPRIAANVIQRLEKPGQLRLNSCKRGVGHNGHPDAVADTSYSYGWWRFDHHIRIHSWG
jgi:hypothetical protein